MTNPVKVELHLAAAGSDCRILVDGKDISHQVRKVEICAEAGRATSMVLHFPIADVTTLGDTWTEFILRPPTSAEAKEAEANAVLRQLGRVKP